MEKGLGLLKVQVVKGTNLAVRDFNSSDPYVVVRLGEQTVKTRVIKRNLNPVWDDELTLLITNPTQPLKLLGNALTPYWVHYSLGGKWSAFSKIYTKFSILPSVLCITNQYEAAVFVWDKDRFSADESLGEAEVDLQPLVAAATRQRVMNTENGTEEIGRVPASQDNALARDSLILLNEGKIVQHLSLKLQKVESGEIEIKLKWVHL